MQYSIDDLVRLAKRDNNNIRPYLYVNPIQGKHIPTNPEDTMMMCRTLANMVNAAYPSDRLYVIGFAETATGIAAGVCHYLDNVVYYQGSTGKIKKKLPDLNYIIVNGRIHNPHYTDESVKKLYAFYEVMRKTKDLDELFRNTNFKELGVIDDKMLSDALTKLGVM